MTTPDVQAHHLAERIVRQWATQQALGAPSVYNIAREVLAEALAGEEESGPA